MANPVKSFEDLEVWKEGMRLVVELYAALLDCRDFGLKDQLQRSAVSIPSNVAEGFERGSNKEYIRFLYVAKGSSGELRTQLHIASRVGLIEKQTCQQFINLATSISKMLHNLIKTRREKF